MKNAENDRRMTPIDSTRKSKYNATPCANCQTRVLPCNRQAAWVNGRKITVCPRCKDEIYSERMRVIRRQEVLV